MGWLRRRTWLERAALAALVATVAAVGVVAFGVFDDSEAEVAAKVTELCRPLAAIDLSDPKTVTRRDLLTLRQVAGDASTGMRGLLKNTSGTLREDVGLLRDGLRDAADPYGQFTLERSAHALFGVSMIAKRIGAECPAPIRWDDAKIIDGRLGRRR